MKKYTIFYSLFLITILQINNIYSQDTLLLPIIKNYENSDGVNRLKYGEKISLLFLENDTLFFQIMEKNRIIFYEWLNKIQYHTYTIYYYKDIKDLIDQKSKLNELKRKMLYKAQNQRKNNCFSEIVNDFIKSLKLIKIRVID